MHRDRSPCHGTVPPHLQILARAQCRALRIVKEFSLHPVVIFLPAVIRKRGHVIKNQPIILGIKSRGVVRVVRAPRCTILPNQFAERRIVRGLLLRPRANKSQQSPRNRQRNIQKPSPTFSTTNSNLPSFHVQDHLRPAQDLLGTKAGTCTTLWGLPYGVSVEIARGG